MVLISNRKPKNSRSKRALAKMEAKLVENPKSALFVPGSSSTKALHDIMCDLMAMKKPLVKRFSKMNAVQPFEDASALEFFAEKNDTSLLVFSCHNKKRPNNLVFTRFFDYKVYDMIELMIQEDYKLLIDFKKQTYSLGLKPMFSFNGPVFDSHPVYMQIKSLILDFFRGEETDLQDVAGLQHIISLTADDVEDDKTILPLVHFRVYKLKTFRLGQKLPRVEVDEIGPRFDFKVGRYTLPLSEVQKEALRKPKQLQAKVKKNVSTGFMGDKIAQIHVGKQDLDKIQTRKMKGLKAKYDQVSDFDNESDDFVDKVNDDEPVSKKQKQ